MLFNSLTFVVFFVVVVALYWSLNGWNLRKNLLVVASYIFYGAWNPPFAALLFSTTAMDFWLGRQISKAQDRHRKKRWLVASVCMNLSMLGFFKYGNFLLQNFQWLLARAGIVYQPPHLDILLPVGISFYTFHSLTAIGAALTLGFHLKDNFRFPYAAIGFSDFWRRWHISLSTFLRDYLYIPLGGNQVRPFRMALNLVIVMFLGGLWHGAAWTFVVWGLLHGSYLVIERVCRLLCEDKPWASNPVTRVLAGCATYGAVCIAWVFVRAADFTIASRMPGGMFGQRPHGD